MKSIVKNGTYVVAAHFSSQMPLESIHRIIWLDEEEDIVVFMRVDEKKLKKPKIWNLSKLEKLAAEKKFVARPLAHIPQHRLTDIQLALRYPPKEDEKTSAPLAYRRKWLAVLDEIKPHLEQVWRKEKSLLDVIEGALQTHSVPQNETYQILYRFLAHGSVDKSVVPNWIFCGGKGKKRVGRGFVLGRKNNDQRKMGLPNDNFPLTPLWLERIQDTYKETVKRGVSLGKAYSTFLNLHCTTSCVVINGEVQITYLDRKDRPSKGQFRTNGPDGTPEEEAWRKQLERNEFEKNFRGMYGNNTQETFRTGVLADVDSTSIDRYLVSVFNRLRGVGPARSLPVVDTQIGYIFGIYVGWSVNGEAAKLSVLNAASDHVEMCRRYGITITPDQWYRCLHAEYRADRGEFNAKVPRESLGSLNRSIEYVISGRPDLRPGEQTHSRLHDHNADGSTFGTFRKRGEKDPAKAANQNIFEYTRELIRLILFHNNHAVVEHLLTAEMRQCGVKPTRKAILEWSKANGYHHEIAYEESDLVLSLCPEMQAVVTPNGVYPVVKRNGNSGDEIILDEFRYLGPFIKQQKWLERARHQKRWRITIRMNPNDPNKIWYQDPDHGLQTFTLATKDTLLCRLATVHDLISTKTDEIGSVAQAKDEADQARAKMDLENSAERKQSKKEKKAQQELAKKSNIESSTGVDRRRNRQAEVAATGQAPIPIRSGEEPPTHRADPKPRQVHQEDDEVSRLMDEWLQEEQV